MRRAGLAGLAALAMVAVLAGAAGAARAQGKAETPNVVLEIQFRGAVNTSEGELFSNLTSRIGEPLDASQVTRDIKTLFSLGYFEQVRAEVEESVGRGFILRFDLDEKPRIVAVLLSGNRQLDDKAIFEEVAVQVGSFYSKASADYSADKIRAAYRAKGYLKVRVTPETEERGEHALALRFRIEESPRLYITDIRIAGTRAFSALEIQRLMQSAEVDCFDWMTESGVFDEDKINQDLQIIVAHYLERGYLRVFLERPKVTLIHNAEFSRIVVELEIAEGEQYFAGQVEITGDILGDKQLLLDRLGVQPGDVFNSQQQNRDTFALREVYQEQGYAFAQIRPDVRIDDDKRIADVTYQISRGTKAYIGRIEFQGNRETRDFVLRREFSIHENELYNGRALRESQQRLGALGYFAPGSLRLELEPQAVDDVLDIVTKLEETQTGTLQAQLGFSDQSGVAISTSVSKGNFLGRGQTLRGSVQWSQRGVTRNFSLDFIEPYLFGSDYSSDSSVSYRTIEDQTELDRGRFTEIYASQGFGHRIVGPLKLNLSLSALNRSFEDDDEPAVQLRTFTTALIYDTVNHPIFPSSGSNVTFSLAQVGGQVLGGSTEYRRYRVRAQRFLSLNTSNSLIFMSRMRLGWLEQVGENLIPPEERFRLGGIATLRGYNFNEVGGPAGRLETSINALDVVQLDEQGNPVLDSRGFPVLIEVDRRTLGMDEDTLALLRGGGIMERLVNLELIFPLAGNNIRGVVFYDAGQVNAEQEQYDILGEQEPGVFDLLQSIGAGVRMITPLGVFRIEYGLKLKVRPGERSSQLDFTIGTLF